ncbi:GNAT family N-acetyltransferase [Paenibacillus thermoaerophilus]|nr:GNAT family protein [Paenibacillus thermoaerophilus]TMV17987.1 GNAT family N-acetyltransferase [Paenibacillus thermoaerophilus]
MDFPVLETERLRLRMPTRSDASDLFRYFSLDEVTRYYDLDSFTEIRQAEELIYTWSERYAHREGIRWGIVLKPSPGRVIGTCGYHNWAKAHRKAEIGFELAPEYWRRGLMTEALEAIVGYGFSRMALNRIEAYIDPDNFASRRLLENAGFSEEGYLRDCFFEKGRFADAVLFALIRRDYVEVHP